MMTGALDLAGTESMRVSRSLKLDRGGWSPLSLCSGDIRALRWRFNGSVLDLGARGFLVAKRLLGSLGFINELGDLGCLEWTSRFDNLSCLGGSDLSESKFRSVLVLVDVIVPDQLSTLGAPALG